MAKKIAACIIFCICFLQAPVYAGDLFEITIQTFVANGYFDGVYRNPPKNTIRSRGTEYVRPFRVVVKNITSSTQRLDLDIAEMGLGQIIFEVTDEKDNKNVITKKADLSKSKGMSYTYLNPGQTKEFDIQLSRADWDNAHNLVEKGATKLRARAAYKNGSNVIYSDYYTIILEE